jgi:hypothetical protein
MKQKMIICNISETCKKYTTGVCAHQKPHKMYDAYCMRTSCGIDGKGKCVEVKKEAKHERI